jgi:hypothetical protein
MSAFNTVWVTATCSNCGESDRQDVQFKFGDCYQHEYAVGDRLDWGGNDRGKPGLGRVLVPGAFMCRSCRSLTDFVVTVEHDVIITADPATEEDFACIDRFVYAVVDDLRWPRQGDAEPDPAEESGPAQ